MVVGEDRGGDFDSFFLEPCGEFDDIPTGEATFVVEIGRGLGGAVSQFAIYLVPMDPEQIGDLSRRIQFHYLSPLCYTVARVRVSDTGSVPDGVHEIKLKISLK